MIIQHNIPALNSFRQLNTNYNALAKNLEKLASGYRINRAGDDAAGLAISEKMRAQIKGLETAAKNAQDGISLIQTAEGALTEVHAMLNRMVELATQSANGIYDDQVDRKALDDEFQALKSEIDRISQATNFNGKNLLDGTLSAGGAGSTAGISNKISADLNGILKFGQAAPVLAVQAQYILYGTEMEDFVKNVLELDPTAVTSGEILAAMGLSGKDYEVRYVDVSGDTPVANMDTAGLFAVDNLMTGTVGTTPSTAFTAGAGPIGLAIVAKTAGVDPGAEAIVTKGMGTVDGKGSGFYEAIVGRDSYRELTLIVDDELANDTNLIGKTFTINGKTYQFTGQNDRNENDQKIKESGERLENGNYAIHLPNAYSATGTNVSPATPQSVAAEIALAINTVEYNIETATNINGVADTNIPGGFAHQDALTGGVTAATLGYTAGTVDNVREARLAQVGKGIFSGGTLDGVGKGVDLSKLNIITFNVADKMWLAGKSGTGSGGGLNLQIGDTSDHYNILSVGVEDMSTKGIGIDKLDISTYDTAKNAIGTTAQQGELGTLKGAINTVSSQRAALGALQNRLEHTISNLGVTTENLTAAESRIRDTDMAKEMMDYTKNNILLQAAQSMLAQANMLPQGVLQLLR